MIQIVTCIYFFNEFTLPWNWGSRKRNWKLETPKHHYPILISITYLRFLRIWNLNMQFGTYLINYIGNVVVKIIVGIILHFIICFRFKVRSTYSSDNDSINQVHYIVVIKKMYPIWNVFGHCNIVINWYQVISTYLEIRFNSN